MAKRRMMKLDEDFAKLFRMEAAANDMSMADYSSLLAKKKKRRGATFEVFFKI